mgnify:CR=1 FL=1|tara:strand:+ start:3327 stop:3869 length:543 start_codon:yes stop_codon:yes gene_type:complete
MEKDLLGECNDQKISEVEFTSIFCKRCKNKTCDRAGWASSAWEERISTQADRFLNRPNIVSQSDSSRWEGIVNLESLEATGEIEVWGVPQRSNPLAFEEIKPLPISEPDPTPPLVQIEEVKPIIEETAKKEDSPVRRVVNTPPQQIMVSGIDHTPKRKSVDEWTVPANKVNVGGTFKMGG